MSEAAFTAVMSSVATAIVAALTFAGIIWRGRHERAKDRIELESARQRAIVELAAERERISTVEGPAANADAWSAVFKVTHETMLSLQADVARLEQRVNDQENEHRVELQERDARERRRELDLQHTADSLRRVRSYVSVVTQLLADNDIAFPNPPKDLDEVALERRSLTAPGTVMSTIEPIAYRDREK
jgi:hypothetical protein